jgi:opacity protein-like surface antigen
MKRILIASAVAFAAGGQAFAADLPPPMAPPPRAPAMYVPVVPLYIWTGFYIGGNVGAGWNSTGSITDTFGSTFGTTTNTSFLGGGQVGVNYEFGGGVVVGAEAMFDWLPNTSNTINATGAGAATGSTAAATINNRWLPASSATPGTACFFMARAVVRGSAPAIHRLRSMAHRPRSLVTAAIISAGQRVSELNGLSRATGQPELSGTTSGCKTRALR